MPYTFSTSFGGSVLAPCLAQLCSEIAASPKYSSLTNLGEIGDATHQTQGTSSDHNPFIIGPPGSAHPGAGYVRAIDLGGPTDLLLALRSELFAVYRAHDPRIYPFGYCKGPDSLIFDWPPGTGYHVDTGDEGHLHISVNQANGFSPSAGGWVLALDSTAPWGIGGAGEEPATSTTEDGMAVAFHQYDKDPTPGRNKAAVYLVTVVDGVGVSQQWLDKAALTDRQARASAAGNKHTAVAHPLHTRDYYGPVIGPDPEKTA